jgi:thiamine-phosphate pyrophosphorylase
MAASARNGRALPPAFFVTDPERTPDPVLIAETLPAGWGVIYRHFGSADRVAVGVRLREACRAQRLVLLVAADPELARSLRADGVHWPEHRFRAVRQRHPGWIETCAAHGLPGLARAFRLGADAALLSPVFASASPSADAPMGPHRFRSLVALARVPVYALGGITGATAGEVFAPTQKRAAGWAAVEAVMSGWGN